LATLSPRLHFEIDDSDERKKEAQNYFEKYIFEMSESGCLLTLISARSLLIVLQNIKQTMAIIVIKYFLHNNEQGATVRFLRR
jgi:hypothetical protein